MNQLRNYMKTLDLIEDGVISVKIKTIAPNIKAAATLLAITIDHAQGIKFCLENSAYPSAFALLRVLFESYIRAMWLWKCADKTQTDRYINEDSLTGKGGKRLTFADMVLEVEKAHQLPAFFSVITKHYWGGLNSLTHSGSIQLHRNFNGTSIAHNYEPEHINDAISFAAMVSSMAFAGLCDLSSNKIDPDAALEFTKSWAAIKR